MSTSVPPNPDAGWRSESRARSGPPTPVLSTRQTHIGSVDLFVGADCAPDARPVVGHPGQFVVHVGPVTLFGTADDLTATLTASLDAVRAARAEVAA